MTEELTPAVLPSEEPVISDHQAQMAVETFRSEQNLIAGTVTGLLASLLGAGLWAGITVVTEYQIGFMAIGIGLLVGFAVRLSGKGMDQVYGVIGAVSSLTGCALGNVFTMTYFIAQDMGTSFMDVLAQLDFTVTLELLTATFEAVDVLFYALAIYFGYKYAFRQITQTDLDRALGKAM